MCLTPEKNKSRHVMGTMCFRVVFNIQPATGDNPVSLGPQCVSRQCLTLQHKKSPVMSEEP